MSNFNNINYGQPQVPVASTVPVQGAPQQQSYAAPVQQPYAPQYAPQPSYGVDQTRFNAPQPMPAPAPAVEVGFFDKVKSYFQDVYRSPENLQAYKQFQMQVDSDPNTVKPGSNDRNRVLDLQQKLQVAGVQVNVNGVYGYATGEAVKQFKQQMNINDGFLNGQGQPAMTDIATPQMMSVLDSVVTKSLNPQLPGHGNPMPVTQEELLWAQNLATRIQNFGYQPNQQEQNRYNDIFARQQQQNVGMPTAPPPSPTVPNVPVPGMQQPTAPTQTGVVPVSQQELDWAMAMQDRIVNTGYRPTPQEAAAYENIQQRYAAQQQTAEPAPQLGSGPVTQDELNWLQAQSGKQLSGNDLARYQNITERYLAQQNNGQVAAPQPAGQLMPVSQEELNWALDLQNKIQTQNYQPTPDEVAKYKDIFSRYESQGVEPVAAPEPAYKPGETPGMSIDNKVSQAELDWAVDLQVRVDQGYQPTHHEIARYTDIFNRYEASQKPAEPAPTTPAPGAPAAPATPAPAAPAHPGASQSDVQWARAFENRIAQGQTATPAEISRYNAIQMTLANYGMAPPAEPTVTQSPAGPAAPAAPGALTQADIDWAMQLQHRVQYQGYQPTQQEIDRYTAIYNQQQQAPAVQPAAPAAPAAPASNAPTAEEMQWAQQLQTAVQQGYQASEAEIAKFTDIYNRLQASQGQPQAPAAQPAAPAAPAAPVAPAQQTPPGSVMINTGTPDHELQWALELLNRYRQGYQPSPSEMAMYENIIAKKAVPGATP